MVVNDVTFDAASMGIGISMLSGGMLPSHATPKEMLSICCFAVVVSLLWL